MTIDAVKGLGLGVPVNSGNKPNDLGQDDFLKLMITQFKNQDPFKPQANGEFLAQLAQFTTASGVGELKSSVEGLSDALASDQALAASSLVGHEVIVASGEIAPGGTGYVEMPAAGEVSVRILDASGQVRRELNLGSQGAGLAAFEWDGLDRVGEALPSGRYRIEATAEIGGREEAVATFAGTRVEGVDLGRGGVTLHTDSAGAVAMGDVRRIQ